MDTGIKVYCSIYDKEFVSYTTYQNVELKKLWVQNILYLRGSVPVFEK